MKYLIVILLSSLVASTCNATAVGSKAPSFSLSAIKNGSGTSNIALDSYKNKVVYVDFWASWCVPCRQSFPILESLRTKYKNKGFEVIAINLDEDMKDAEKFLEKFSVSFPVVRDVKGQTASLYDLRGMPSAFIIDRRGVTQYVVTGFDSKKEPAEIESVINKLMKTNP